MAKRPVPLYDFAAFGQAIKAARTARKESRKDVSDAMNISPRYLTNIENKGQISIADWISGMIHLIVTHIDSYMGNIVTGVVGGMEKDQIASLCL